MSSSELHALQKAFVAAGGHWTTFIIWAKDRFTLGRSDYQRQFEPILYGWPEGVSHHGCGARDEGDAWFIDRPSRNDLHPTKKPVGLVERAIRNSSPHGGLVLDPFGGSGTTLIAAERTGRVARLLELDPRYVDVIVARWQAETGRDAMLDGDGRSFAKVKAERLGTILFWSPFATRTRFNIAPSSCDACVPQALIALSCLRNALIVIGLSRFALRTFNRSRKAFAARWPFAVVVKKR
jgi:hypothetical protein